MIISASRRTDIPAFYAEWFLNRLQDGFCKVKNPFNPKQIKTVSLLKKDVECIVFWTRNSAKLRLSLNIIEDLTNTTYFLYTVTNYGKELEPNLPEFEDTLDDFKQLSERTNTQRVIWRYDPIIFNEKYSPQFHIANFEKIAKALHKHTDTVIISYADYYNKTLRNLASYSSLHTFIQQPEQQQWFAECNKRLLEIATSYELNMRSCADITNVASFGIKKGKCIDDSRIQNLTCNKTPFKTDTGQRKECNCVKSVDIGAYNTCGHGCLYCYACSSPVRAKNNQKNHNPESEFLL